MGEISGGEVKEAEGSEVSKPEMDRELSSELEKTYQSYLEGDRTQEAEQPESGRLTEADRAKLREETGWSDEVVSRIETPEQAEIYKNADLHEETIDGRECLVKKIDYDYIDEKTGMTNRELMAKGRSPIDAKSGEKIELHHMGQDYDSPFAELTENSEHGDGNHAVLHPKTEGSWRNDPELEKQYARERKAHWKARSEEGGA